jgi:hypothetical protein
MHALTLPMLVLLSALGPVTPVRAAERPTVNRRTGLCELPLVELRRAAEQDDRSELARTAERLGPARLGKALGSGDRRVVLAALEGIPLVPAGALLLDQVLPLDGAPDVAVRERALGATSALLGGGGQLLTEWEVPAETVRAACRALAAAAADPALKLGHRLLALQGLFDAGPTCAGDWQPAALLTATEPEIRRAGVLALPATAGTNESLFAAARDPDGRVAAAVGARLCALRGKPRPPATTPPLRQLALADGAAPEDILDILPCLTSSKDPEDQKALAALAESGPGVVRDAIKAKADAQPRP